MWVPKHQVITAYIRSCFTSLCYTADGQCLLAGGRSKFVCIYNVPHQVLLKKFQISRNRSFDGMQVGVAKGRGQLIESRWVWLRGVVS